MLKYSAIILVVIALLLLWPPASAVPSTLMRATLAPLPTVVAVTPGPTQAPYPAPAYPAPAPAPRHVPTVRETWPQVQR